MLSVEARILQRAHAVYSRILAFHVLTIEGRHDEAASVLGNTIGLCAHGMRELTDFPSFEPKAAEGVDLPQRPMRVICGIGIAEPDTHAPQNDHHATPTHPAPSIA